MKKGLVTKLGAAALALSLVTASLVGGTFAKYTKSVTGSASGTVAAFKFTVDNLNTSNEIAIKLNGENKIKPGDEGSFAIDLTSTSDVDVQYTVTLNTANLTTLANGKAITIYTDSSMSADSKYTDPISSKILADDSTKKTVTFYWQWEEGADISEINASTVEIPVTVLGEQSA